MITKKHLRSQLRLIRDMRNMASLNRRFAGETQTVRQATRWEATFDKQIRRLTIRLRLTPATPPPRR